MPANQYQCARTDLQLLIEGLKEQGVEIVYEPGLTDDQYVRGFLRKLNAFAEARSTVIPDSAFRTYWNRITYKQHFRRPLAKRAFLPEAGNVRSWELAVDLRQWSSSKALQKTLEKYLPRYAAGYSESEGGVIIGDFVPYSQSLIWQFNTAFWNHVLDFVSAHSRDYRDSIKGSPDADPKFVHHTAQHFFEEIKRVRLTDSETIYYVEIGVASVDYARTFIETLTALAHTDAVGLGSITYVLVDTSQSVLVYAQKELGSRHRGINLRYEHANAGSPAEALRPFVHRILRVHLTNVFDNLPGDKLAQIDGERFLIETRLYLPARAFDKLIETYALNPVVLKTDLAEIPAIGVDTFLDRYRTHFQQIYGETEGDLKFYECVSTDRRNNSLKK